MNRRTKALAGLALVAIPAGGLAFWGAKAAFDAWIMPPAEATAEPAAPKEWADMTHAERKEQMKREDINGDGVVTLGEIMEAEKTPEQRKAEAAQTIAWLRWKEAGALLQLCQNSLYESHRPRFAAKAERDEGERIWRAYLEAEKRETMRLDAEKPIPAAPDDLFGPQLNEDGTRRALTAHYEAMAERNEGRAGRCMKLLAERPQGQERVWSVQADHHRERENLRRNPQVANKLRDFNR